MAEPTQFTFTYKEIVEAMLKKQDIHTGIWGLYVEFGLGASNVGANEQELKPAAIIPILKIGLQKFEKESNIAVDAAKVNPERHPVTKQ
jgi:hypothetical protein